MAHAILLTHNLPGRRRHDEITDGHSLCSAQRNGCTSQPQNMTGSALSLQHQSHVHARTLVCYIATHTSTCCIDSCAMICRECSWHAAHCACAHRCRMRFVEDIPASLCCEWSAASDVCSPEAAKGHLQPTPLDLRSAGRLQGRAPELQHPPIEAHPALHSNSSLTFRECT